MQDEEDMEHSVDESDGCESGNEERENTEKPMTAKALIRSKPWYKPVANLHLWNPSFINVVLNTRALLECSGCLFLLERRASQ